MVHSRLHYNQVNLIVSWEFHTIKQFKSSLRLKWERRMPRYETVHRHNFSYLFQLKRLDCGKKHFRIKRHRNLWMHSQVRTSERWSCMQQNISGMPTTWEKKIQLDECKKIIKWLTPIAEQHGEKKWIMCCLQCKQAMISLQRMADERFIRD